MKIATHLDVLAEAKSWRTNNQPDTRLHAIAVLEAGMKRYPDALALGEELVLLHKENGDLDKAVELLRRLERRFRQVSEETLCRWGSVIRFRANQKLQAHAIGAAIVDLKEAEGYFARAFEEFGTHYPRINQLSTRLARAGLARLQNDETTASKLLRSVEEDLESFLDDATIWSRLKPHDAIWAHASRGEACLILMRWDDAEAAYADAHRASGVEIFARQSMAKQIRDILIPAFSNLGRQIEGRLADPDHFFGISKEQCS